METWFGLFCFICLIWIRCLTGVRGEDVGVVVGGTATLPCQVDVTGQVDVYWYDPDSRLLTRNENVETSDPRFELDHPYYDEWNLIINGVEDQDKGTYTCKVYTNPVKNKLVNLIIHHPPTIDDTSGDVSPVTGSDITLHCHASGVPEPEVTWHKYTKSGSKELLAHEGETYTINNVSRHDSGTYECTAENTVPPTDSAQMKVDVRFEPFTQVPYEELNQEVGKETLLQCMITANPHDVMYWEKDGVKLEPSSKYDIMIWDVEEYKKNLAVKVIDLEPQDFGEYTCVAENAHGVHQASMHLYETHTGNLRVLSKPKDVISQQGANVLFNCTVEGITQTDSLTWWHFHPESGFRKIFVSNPSQSKVPFLDDEKYEIRGHYDLFIRLVDSGDFGEYVCDITNQDNYTAHLTLVETPACMTNSTAVNEGEPAELTCTLEFSGHEPNWQVDWEHGDRKLSSVNLDEIGTLIREVKFRAAVGDSGLYVCQISTKEPSYSGSCSAEIDVIKLEPTPAPACPGPAVGSLPISTFWIVIGFCIFALIVIFCGALVGIAGYYRKKLRKTKEAMGYADPDKPAICETAYNNGGFTAETEPADSKVGNPAVNVVNTCCTFPRPSDEKLQHFRVVLREATSQDVRYRNGRVSLETEGLTTEPREEEV